MELYYGLPILAALGLAFVYARRAYRRQQLRRRRPRRELPLQAITKASARSDMRACEDPSTVMDTVRRPGVPKQRTGRDPPAGR